MVLKEKGLPYEQILIDAQNKPQDFLDLSRSITSNPNHRGTVPAIVGKPVPLLIYRTCSVNLCSKVYFSCCLSQEKRLNNYLPLVTHLPCCRR